MTEKLDLDLAAATINGYLAAHPRAKLMLPGHDRPIARAYIPAWANRVAFEMRGRKTEVNVDEPATIVDLLCVITEAGYTLPEEARDALIEREQDWKLNGAIMGYAYAKLAFVEAIEQTAARFENIARDLRFTATQIEEDGTAMPPPERVRRSSNAQSCLHDIVWGVANASPDRIARDEIEMILAAQKLRAVLDEFGLIDEEDEA